MVDLHSHILPGVDDGAESLDEAMAMARFCVADGIKHVFATPHCHRYVHLLRADVLPRVAELNRAFAEAEIPLTVWPGSEIQVTDTRAYRAEFEAGLYCHYGDQREFTLLEFSWAVEQYPLDAVNLIEWIRAQGTTPILAHPERHDYFWSKPALLDELVAAGAWVQITVDSLMGNHGPRPQVAGKALLQKYANAVLATDSHRMTRCSGLSSGYIWTIEHLGQEQTDNLMARANQVLERVRAKGDRRE
jgi:protein-tyrosine phosphatase